MCVYVSHKYLPYVQLEEKARREKERLVTGQPQLPDTSSRTFHLCRPLSSDLGSGTESLEVAPWW